MDDDGRRRRQWTTRRRNARTCGRADVRTVRVVVMEFQRAVGIPPTTPGVGAPTQDENANATPFGRRRTTKTAMTATTATAATPSGVAKRGLGGKTFGATPGAMTPASSRSALGNITNARGGTRLGGTKEVEGGKRAGAKAATGRGGLSILSDAPEVKTTTTTTTESQDWLETVKARLTPSELAALRERAERYADESDESDYRWAGKTKAQQMKDLEAQQRAEVEERVRAILSGGAPERSRVEPGTSASEGAARAAMSSVRLDGAGEGLDDDEFDLGSTLEDDFCNMMSPVKMDEDDDTFRPPSPGTALAMFDDVMDF
jgi:hypothetical protein